MPAESSAIRKLGRLFRLTEVHLWDDYYVTGAREAHNWHAAETGCTGSRTGKSRDRPAKQTDEDSFVEDMELASLMGSLGLPVSFSTSKEKKNTPIKGEHQGRQASYEPVNTPIDGDVRTCANTEEIASVPKLMACVGHTNSCILSRTDVDKMLSADSPYAEDSVFGTICCDEIVPGDEVGNQCELETCQFHDNMSKPVQSESSVQENQVVDSVMQLNKVMLGQIPVAYESVMTCTELCQEGKLCAREDQIGGETPCISHDKNDAECKVCLSPAEPCPVNNHVEKSCSDFYYEYGDWKVLWDQFYSRYYFYNILTQESTWYTPQGLEDFALHCSTYTSQGMDELGSHYTSQGTDELGLQYTSQGMDELGSKKFDESSGVLSCADNTMDDYISEADQHVTVQYGAQLSACDNGFDKTGADRHLDVHRQDLYKAHNLSDIPDEESINLSVVATIEEAQHDENIQNGRSVTEVLNMHQEVSTTQKKKRVRRSQSYHSCQDLVENISSDIAKYWTQRYSLFSLFDSGIKMDEEGWFSVTPELIAKHHASRVGTGTLIDCFTGVGGNAIQFATQCKHVIAVDIDPQKIGCAQHNATVYGVNDHIDFVVGDFIHIAPHLKGETAFMSPPWGGPDYAKADVYDIKTMLKPCDGYTLFKLATLIASRVVMFLPRNIDLSQLADMCMSVDPPWTVEVEKNFLNGKLKAITAYFEQHDASDVQQ